MLLVPKVNGIFIFIETGTIRKNTSENRTILSDRNTRNVFGYFTISLSDLYLKFLIVGKMHAMILVNLDKVLELIHTVIGLLYSVLL